MIYFASDISRVVMENWTDEMRSKAIIQHAKTSNIDGVLPRSADDPDRRR